MSKKSLPALTHLHYLVLGVLRPGEQPGRVLRQALASYGVRRSAPAFYPCRDSKRPGSSKAGAGEIVVHDQAVTERRYRITPRGEAVDQSARVLRRSGPAFLAGAVVRCLGTLGSASRRLASRRLGARSVSPGAGRSRPRAHRRGGFGWTYALRLTILWLQCVQLAALNRVTRDSRRRRPPST